MPDLNLDDLKNNKEFLAAPAHEKIAFLSSQLPEFAKASPKDQADFLQEALAPGAADNPVPKNYGFTPSNLYEGAKRGLQGIIGAGKEVLFPEGNTEGERLQHIGQKMIFEPAERENELARRPDQSAIESIGHSTAAAIPMIGPWIAGLAERAGTGDIGGATAEAGTQFGAAKLADVAVKRGLPALGEPTARLLRDENNRLRPIVNVGARLGGAYLGHTTGIPEAGVAGFITGRAIADALIPKRAPVIDTPMDPRSQPARLPASEDFYEHRAQDLMRRGREEGRLQPVTSGPRASSAGAVRTIPEPRPQFEGEEPGYMASVPRRRLASLAETGKPGAGTQLQQLGEKVIYEPSGAGIRNVKESVGPIGGNALGPNEATVDRFYDPKTRQWAPEREQIHEQVIADALKGKTPATGRPPEATITVGGTGAGKTTLTRHVLGENPNLVNVDADVFKLKVPEFERLKAEDPQRAAFRVHDESAHMAKRTVSAAVQKGLDFIFDTSTGGSGDALFSKLKQAGYKVRVLFADVPTEDAIQRANLRARESTDPANRGRYVPEEVIREKHQVAAKAFDGYRRSPHIDELFGYDTASRTPRKFYERVGQQERIHDSGRLEDVRRKAAGQQQARTNRNEEAVLVH